MPDTTVRVFRSTDTGAPTLSNVAGTLIAVLDGCLADGYGSVTLDSLVIASNVATCTLSTGHGFTAIGATGPVVRIAGATPAGLNGDWRITYVSATVFTFAVTGITDQTATGTITAKRAPGGFEKAFTGTNLAVYRSLDITGTRLYCRIDDTTTTYARIRGYEAMSDVNTGTGLFPTDGQQSGGGYVYKANAASRPWTLFTDGRMIYFFCDSTGTAAWPGGFLFGDVASYKAGDAFGCALISSASSGGQCQLFDTGTAPSASYLARTHLQSGGSIIGTRCSHSRSSGLGAGGQTYPAPVDNLIHLWPVECWEGTTLARGMLPGLWNPIHDGDTPHGTVVEDIPNLPGRALLIQTTRTASYECVMDCTGPWR
jgi:hypothetical protein